MLPDYSKDVQGIVQQWYDAAEKEVLNKNEISQLYHNTGQVVQTLQELKNSGQTEKVKDLSNILIQKFNDHDIGESKLLAHWVSKNEGACESLHELFQLVADVNNSPQAFTTEHEDGAALTSIPQVRDLEKIILSNLDLKSSSALSQTSKHQNELFKSHLIDRLNNGEMRILRLKSISEIIDYFGEENCAKDYGEENLNFAAAFPNLKHLSLDYISSEMVFPENLESLDISDSSIKNVSDREDMDLNFIKELKSLKKLNIAHNLLYDNELSFLKELNSLEEIDISNNQISDPTFFENKSKLVVLDIKDTNITDLSFIKKLPLLTTLYFGNNNLHLPYMKVLRECPSITNLGICCSHTIKNEFLDDLKLPNLKHLLIPKVESFDFLSACTSLEKLGFIYNYSDDLSLLPKLKKLEEFELIYSDIKDISELTKLPLLNLNFHY